MTTKRKSASACICNVVVRRPCRMTTVGGARSRPPLRFRPVVILLCLLGATATAVAAAAALNLSPVEKFLLGSRLETISERTRSDFLTAHRPRLVVTPGKSDESSVRAAGVSTEELDVVVIFPGAGGPDALTAELRSSIVESDSSPDDAFSPRSKFVEVWDWSEHRGSIATAAYDSEAVGEAVADAILSTTKTTERRSSSLRSVHSIGISVGAFAANAFARKCCKVRNDVAPYVRLTLLDPFCSRGLVGVGYGAANFGLDVDYAEQFMNTDDPVPTTNDPLPLCAVYDVTGAKARDDFVPPEGDTMHSWPVAYYARYYGQHRSSSSVAQTLLPTHGRDGAPSRGTVTQVR